MVWRRTSSYSFFYFLFTLFVHRGISQVVITGNTQPASGTVVSDFVSERNVSLFCEVMLDGEEHATVWSILTLEDKEAGQDPGPIPRDDPQFILSGDIILASPFEIFSNRNLTIVGLTASLHDSTIFCGAEGSRIANFTFLIYDYPSLPSNLSVAVAATHAYITWDPPTNPGSPRVAYYQLTVLRDGDVLYNVSIPASSAREFNASSLQPGTNHSLSIRAVSQLSPVPVIGNTTEIEFTTNFTVPLVNCTAAEISGQRIASISWDSIHTGGLSLMSAVVEYTPSPSSMGAKFTEVVNASIDLEGGRAELQSLPTAGLTYVFRVATENAEGKSVPSQCPPLFLEIGTPSIPDMPTAVGNGPLAQVMLRTSEAGVTDPPHSFRFILQVFRLNSSDSGADFVREVEEGLAYPEYESGDTVVANVEGLELGREYQFAAQAVNVFGTSQVSNLSNPVLLNLSVPVISDVVIRVVDEGIVIEWDFLHNGGLDILAVEILLRQDSSGPYQPVQGGNLSQPLTNTFLIAGRFLQAGQRYQAAVSVTNAVGRSELVDTESQESPVGVPTIPSTPVVTSVTSSSVVLTLQTASSGLLPPGDSLRFIVLVNSSDSGPEEFTSLSQPFPSYTSGESVQVAVDTLEEGRSYIFSAQVQNVFGRSNSSGVSENVTIPFSDEGSDGLSTRDVIGIAIAVFVLLVMSMVIAALVICVIMNKGGRAGKLRKSRRESDTDLGIQIAVPHIDTDMSYPRRREDTPFPPEAYESQYEPASDVGHFIVLRPRPTHPTLESELDDQPHPLYDLLSPHEESRASMASGKELPNPLYSGLPISAGNSRPTSQFHDSGSGSVQHGSGIGVVWNGSREGTVGEPQYSEATGQSSSDGQGPLYMEPTSRSSQHLEGLSTPPPPPLPPHPRDIPMYAEAGPPSGVEESGRLGTDPSRPLSLGSQEHLYSELKDLPRKGKPDACAPVFHTPPPPPPKIESAGEFTSHSSTEGEVTAPMGDGETVL